MTWQAPIPGFAGIITIRPLFAATNRKPSEASTVRVFMVTSAAGVTGSTKIVKSQERGQSDGGLAPGASAVLAFIW